MNCTVIPMYVCIMYHLVMWLICVHTLYRATHVQNEDGSVVLLSATNPRQRNAIAKRLLTPSKEGPMGGATKKVCVHNVLNVRVWWSSTDVQTLIFSDKILHTKKLQTELSCYTQGYHGLWACNGIPAERKMLIFYTGLPVTCVKVLT